MSPFDERETATEDSFSPHVDAFCAFFTAKRYLDGMVDKHRELEEKDAQSILMHFKVYWEKVVKGAVTL